jgi:hypothetical protein
VAKSIFARGLAMNLKKLNQLARIGVIALLIQSCQTLSFSARTKTADNVNLPFIKNSANECYYLDEFMPLPDGMVTGKAGSLSLRYYNYKAASFKDWQDKQIVLAFYSSDDRCWSLFEEYYVSP